MVDFSKPPQGNGFWVHTTHNVKHSDGKEYGVVSIYRNAELPDVFEMKNALLVSPTELFVTVQSVDWSLHYEDAASPLAQFHFKNALAETNDDRISEAFAVSMNTFQADETMQKEYFLLDFSACIGQDGSAIHLANNMFPPDTGASDEVEFEVLEWMTKCVFNRNGMNKEVFYYKNMVHWKLNMLDKSDRVVQRKTESVALSKICNMFQNSCES